MFNADFLQTPRDTHGNNQRGGTLKVMEDPFNHNNDELLDINYKPKSNTLKVPGQKKTKNIVKEKKLFFEKPDNFGKTIDLPRVSEELDGEQQI